MASFTLDSGGVFGDRIQNLRIALAAVDTKTNSLASQTVLDVDDFGGIMQAAMKRRIGKAN